MDGRFDIRGLITMGLLTVCLALCLAAAEDDEPDPLPIGSPIPDFTLPGVDGRSHSLRDFAAARVLVIVFTCNHCPTAQAYERRIMQLHARYQGRPVALVAISPNDPLALRPDEQSHSDLGDSFDEMKLRATARGFAFPYLYDGGTQAFSRALGAQATPHVFIFDRERKLRYQGGIDEPGADPEERQFARDAIDALLEDKPVTLPVTRAFGCSVKWSGIRAAVQRAQEESDARPVGLRPLLADEARQLVHDDARPALVIGLWDSTSEAGRRMLTGLVAIHRIHARRGVQVITLCLDPGGAGERVTGLLTAAHASCDNYHVGTGDPAALAKVCDPEWQGGKPHVLVIVPGKGVVYRKSGETEVTEIRRVLIQAME